MSNDTTFIDGDEVTYPWDYQEKSLSASLTVRWSRKRKRWESDHAFLWYDRRRQWSCRSDDGKYYYGFRSFRKLLKSYVGGTLCEEIRSCPMKKVKAKYWFSQQPRKVTCRVTTQYTRPVLDGTLRRGGMKL